jgi:O-acetylserine/cysteine efflux transporter
MKFVDILLAFVATFIWGATWLFYQSSLAYLTPLALVALRCSVSAVIAIPFVKSGLYLPRKLVTLFTLSSGMIYGGIAIALWLGIATPAGIILTELSVPFSIILSVGLLRENVSMIQIIGIAATFIGVSHAIGDITDGFSLVSAIFVIAAAVGIAFSNILLKSYSNYDSFGLVAYSSAALAVIFGFLSYFLEGNGLNFISRAPLSVLLSTLYLATLPMLAWGIWSYLISKYAISLVSSFQLFSPIFGLLISYAMLDAKIGITFMVGSCIMFVGHIITIRTYNGKDADE